MSKHVTTQTPCDEILRTANSDAGSGREEIERIAIFNDGWVVHLPDIALEIRSEKRSVDPPQRPLAVEVRRDKYEFSMVDLTRPIRNFS